MDLDVYVLIPNKMIYKKRPKITFKGKAFFPKKGLEIQDKLLKNHLKWKHYHSNVVFHYRSTPSPLSPDHSVFVEMYVAITHQFVMFFFFYHLRTEITKKTCKLIGKQFLFILLHWLCFSDLDHSNTVNGPDPHLEKRTCIM